MAKLALSPSHPQHALFVAANDTACAWGANESGQLGRTPPHVNGGDPFEIHDDPVKSTASLASSRSLLAAVSGLWSPIQGSSS